MLVQNNFLLGLDFLLLLDLTMLFGFIVIWLYDSLLSPPSLLFLDGNDLWFFDLAVTHHMLTLLLLVLHQCVPFVRSLTMLVACWRGFEMLGFD